MSFTAVGVLTSYEDSPSGTSSVYSLTTHTVGNVILIGHLTGGTSWVTAMSGGGCTWEQVDTTVDFSPQWGGFGNLWKGTVVTPGTADATVTFSGTVSGNNRLFGNEFSVTSGASSAVAEMTGDVAGDTSDWPKLTPAGSGRLYWGCCEDSGSAVAGSTPGFTYEVDGRGNCAGFDVNVSAACQPVWGDSGQLAGVMVLMQEKLPVPPGGSDDMVSLLTWLRLL